MKKTRFFKIVFIGILLNSCGTSEKPNYGLTSRKVVELPKFHVHEEDIYDAPIKTQITLHVIIDEDEIDERMIRNLLTSLYSKIMKRTGFDYRTSPSSAYIYAYTSKEKAQSGMGQWIGMISKSHVDTHSSISVNDIQMNSLSETKENRWELTYEQRQELWEEIIKSEDRAQKEADEKYSLDVPNLTVGDRKNNSQYSDQLKEKYASELVRRFRIEEWTIDSVSHEGLVNGWPFPEYK